MDWEENEGIFDITAQEGEIPPLDASVFFPPVLVQAVEHNKDCVWNDIKTGKAKPLNLYKKSITKTDKQKWKNTSEDIHKNPKIISGIYRLVRGGKIYSPTLSVLSPLRYIPFNALDIRTETFLSIGKVHSDIYTLPLPLGRYIKRQIRIHKKTVIRISGGVVIVAVGSVLVLFGLKVYIQTQTQTAYQDLLSLQTISNLQDGRERILDAQKRFNTADFLFTPFSFLLDSPIYSNPVVHTASKAIYGWKYLSRSLADATNLVDLLEAEATQNNPSAGNNFPVSAFTGSVKITDFLQTNQPIIADLHNNLEIATLAYAQIGSLGSPTLDAKLQKAVSALLHINQILRFTLNNFPSILTMLGNTQPQRYMILNQNRDELRAAGGFPWTVITFEIYKGVVTNFERKDIYDYDWRLYPYHENPPAGLDRISSNYGMRDANYYVDFSDSLKKIDFFYEKAGWGSITTLVAINQGIILDLLKDIGKVHVDAINEDIDANTFSTVLSTLVEAKVVPYMRTGVDVFQTPKSVLFSFMDDFLHALAVKKDISGYSDVMAKAFKNAEILMASQNTDVQGFIDGLHITDNWKNDTGNWAYPLFTSLSGNKSDRYVHRTFTINSTTLTGCTVQNTFTLASTHTFNSTDEAQLNSVLARHSVAPQTWQNLVQIQWWYTNKQFVRLVVPANAELLTEGSGMDIGVDNSNPKYSVFSWYTNVDVGKTTQNTFAYKVAVPNCQSNIHFYKQAGLANINVLANGVKTLE